MGLACALCVGVGVVYRYGVMVYHMRIIGAQHGRKLFTSALCIVVYMRKIGGALFYGVYIGRFYRGEWRFFLRMCTKVLDSFCIILYYRGSLNKSSVNIKTR